MLTSYEMGLPVYYFDKRIVEQPEPVRIVGGGEDGEWITTEGGNKVYAKPIVSTTGGIVFETTLDKLSDIDEVGVKALCDAEQIYLINGSQMYGGKFKPKVTPLSAKDFYLFVANKEGIRGIHKSESGIWALMEDYAAYIQSAK